MELLVVTAIVIGFILISLLKKRVPPADSAENSDWWHRMENESRTSALVDLDIERFETLSAGIIEDLGLEIVDKEDAGPNEVLFHARNRQPLIGGDYLVLILLETRGGGPVGPARIAGLKRMVREEGALKGIVLTNTYVAGESISELEGEPVEIVDGIELGRLLEASG